MSEKKYELIPSDKTGLYRIKALKDFANVKVGDIGGYVSGEHNLSHNDFCWIYNDAQVYDNAIVSDDAQVYDSAIVSGSAIVSDSAQVYGDAQISDNAIVYGHAQVSGSAQVSGYALVSGRAQVYGSAIVFGSAIVSDYARVYGRVYGNAQVSGHAQVFGRTRIYSGTIKKSSDYMLIGPIGSRDDFTTFFKAEDKIMVSCGCYKGTIQEFEQKVKETHKDTIFAHQYLNAILCCKTRI